ncbi:ABC transporter substrate-binding protein [Chromobacterium sp. IIBBL 290-4]|uniref:substrate-binding periplasmic protein n=1 Tax=Chromobacterium sp. IIBBL 290-4 TaxID=2953890 RepID=UPI0020B8745F|nr:transporter substrate-binding domain-containing protein [Chromobacterium sp. IIBBL 290-4]UTH73242.1 transporter substrate-binding domain-containing protein [Chromobacterium sp. IIBBL 290-4]
MLRLPGWRLAAALFCLSGAGQAAPLRACASDIDFPPFAFTASSGFAGGAQDTGLAINVLQRALRRAGREPAVIQRLPWRRCREGVAHGQTDIAIDVPTSELDPKRALATEAYATVHHLYFYSTRKFPTAPPLRALSDLKRYTVCGLFGSHLDVFGIAPSRQDSSAKNERSAIGKVMEGRCDVFIEIREVVDSLSQRDAAMRDLFAAAPLRHEPLPGDMPSGLHYEISLALKDAPALQRSFNATILDLINNKEMPRMMP